MEKRAWVGTALYGGMELLGLRERMKEMKKKTQLSPIRRDVSLKLKSPYRYQFEGGKYTGLAKRMTPHIF